MPAGKCGEWLLVEASPFSFYWQQFPACLLEGAPHFPFCWWQSPASRCWKKGRSAPGWGSSTPILLEEIQLPAERGGRQCLLEGTSPFHFCCWCQILPVEAEGDFCEKVFCLGLTANRSWKTGGGEHGYWWWSATSKKGRESLLEGRPLFPFCGQWSTDSKKSRGSSKGWGWHCPLASSAGEADRQSLELPSGYASGCRLRKLRKHTGQSVRGVLSLLSLHDRFAHLGGNLYGRQVCVSISLPLKGFFFGGGIELTHGYLGAEPRLTPGNKLVPLSHSCPCDASDICHSLGLTQQAGCGTWWSSCTQLSRICHDTLPMLLGL